MATDFVRLNLPRFQAVSLLITSVHRWDDGMRETFGELTGESGQFVSGAIYRRAGKRHIVSAHVGVLVPDDLLGISLFYDVGEDAAKVTYVPRQFRREAELLAAVELLEFDYQVDCVAQFLFEDVEEQRLWFPLPTQIGHADSDEGLYEIRSLSGVKLSSQSEAFPEFKFDLARWQSAVEARITFSLYDRIDRSLPTKVLDVAARSVDPMVRGS